MGRRQRAEAIRGGAFQVFARPDQAGEGRNRRCRQGLAEEESRRRLGLPALAEGIWRARGPPDSAGDMVAWKRRLQSAYAARPQRRWQMQPIPSAQRVSAAQMQLTSRASLSSNEQMS